MRLTYSEGKGVRTLDNRIKSAVLYRLSYTLMQNARYFLGALCLIRVKEKLPKVTSLVSFVMFTS